jgi:diguanylate cyclase (GGDEF)-like protein/PAS domain S-box-containing protein
MSNARDVRHILVVEDQKSKRIVALRENSYTLGRDPASSIVIYDRQVSRHHATLLRVTDYQNHQDFYRVIDGNLQGKRSTNGILINGKYSLSHELRSGDTIRFGSKAKASYQVVSAAEIELLEQNNPAENAPESVFESYAEEDLELQEEEHHTLAFEITGVDADQPRLRQASLGDCSPGPIVEMNARGEIVYLNPAASIGFPDLPQLQSAHPLLQGLLEQSNQRDGTPFQREIAIANRVYEQYVYFLDNSQSIRTFLFEITKYKQIEPKISVDSERAHFILQQTTEGIFWVDTREKKIIETNLAYCKLLGYTKKELIGRELYGMLALDREQLDRQLERLEPEKPYYVEESRHRCQDGSLVEVEETITRSHLAGVEIFCFSVRHIGERKRFEEKLRHRSIHDSLTDLPNRTHFDRQLTVALVNAFRSQSSLGVMFLDLDSFQQINSLFGHSLGDRVLQSCAQRLTELVGDGDTIARWGSDEFAILLPRVRNGEDTGRLAQKIANALKQPMEIEGQTLTIRTSIGIALYPQDGEDEETLLKNASAALSKAKESGRYQHEFYTPLLSEEANSRFKLENLLHQALEKQEFSLLYQPQLRLVTGEITGIEALLRWNHPSKGTLLPGKFLPLAEKTDLLLSIGKWVLTRACERARSWQKDGLKPIPICVNLSSQEFAQPNLVEAIARILDKTGLDPQWLEVEITEKTLRQNLSSARQIFQDLQNLGVRVALDDFGTGHSALGYLQQFPFRTLKLNQDFIRDLRGSAKEQAIVTAAIALGQGFHFRVVAEGVETKQQLEFLQNLHCEEAQGYYFSHPLTAEATGQFLDDHRSVLTPAP